MVTGSTANEKFVSIQVSDVLFSNNTSNAHGSAFNYIERTNANIAYLSANNQLIFDHVAFLNNLSGSHGVAVVLDRVDNITIENSLFQDNKSEANYGGGLAITRSGDIQIIDTSFIGNQVDNTISYGGGLYVGDIGIIGMTLPNEKAGACGLISWLKMPMFYSVKMPPNEDQTFLSIKIAAQIMCTDFT